VRERIGAYRKAGVDMLLLGPTGEGAAAQLDTLGRAVELIPAGSSPALKASAPGRPCLHRCRPPRRRSSGTRTSARAPRAGGADTRAGPTRGPARTGWRC